MAHMFRFCYLNIFWDISASYIFHIYIFFSLRLLISFAKQIVQY